ncbi:MAG: M23 family metallopeptidase [Blastochloris sp.]|nr:M23 family metallopeptidase [Blastochloris sp.]
MAADRRARLLAQHNDWLKVELDGIAGWVRADLLDIGEGLLDTLPFSNDFPPLPPTWAWPTYGALTSGFGPRWGSFHYGIDIANSAGTPIVAARAGRVIESGWCSGYGYCVKLLHEGGITTIYGHMLDQPSVGVGQAVKVGQLLGRMGSTYDARGGGYSTGVHLHFEVKVGGAPSTRSAFCPEHPGAAHGYEQHSIR